MSQIDPRIKEVYKKKLGIIKNVERYHWLMPSFLEKSKTNLSTGNPDLSSFLRLNKVDTFKQGHKNMIKSPCWFNITK